VRAGPLGKSYRLFPGTTRPAVELRLRAEFEVVEGGPGGVGELMEGLAAKVLACNRSESVEAAARLASIEDDRAVKWLVRAFSECRNPSVRYQALGALTKFKTDEALEGLRLAASDADEDFRTAAANVLLTSKHPKARGLLASLRRDPYYGVRMVALLGLEGSDTAEARRLIQEMTNDEHPLVRAEALRFLQERATHPPRR
jgi:HEAT repeat protein